MKHWGTMSLDSATGDHSEKNVSNPCCFQKAFYLLILFNLFGSKMSWNVLNRTIPYFLSKFSHMLKPSQNIALPNCHVSHDILLLESPYPFVGPSDIPTHVFFKCASISSTYPGQSVILSYIHGYPVSLNPHKALRRQGGRHWGGHGGQH